MTENLDPAAIVKTITIELIDPFGAVVLRQTASFNGTALGLISGYVRDISHDSSLALSPNPELVHTLRMTVC